MPVSGGQYLVKTLYDLGIRKVSCVAGESYLPVLDALVDYPDILLVTNRQESGATFMAEAWGALDGQTPGVAMVTRGPGACNASIGVHAAMQASSPMILFVGLIATGERDREAFQEFDLRQMFGSLCKWAAVIDGAERIGEYVTRAVHIARAGRKGPVVLGLSEEILSEMVDVADHQVRSVVVEDCVPSATSLVRLHDILAQAARPIVIAGGSGWSDAACADLESFVSASQLPVAASFRRHDLFDHRSVHYIGELGTGPNPALVERVRQADVVLALGARLNAIAVQDYTLIGPQTRLIHVHPSAEVFGKPYGPELAVQCAPQALVRELAAGFSLDGRRWAEWRAAARADYETWSAIDRSAPEAGWQGADMTRIFGYLQDALPDNAIITTDAGNFSGWCQRYLRYSRPGRLLAPISGAMGYAVPSAIAASLACPGRVVAGFCGDGGFMMTMQELATAVHHGAKPVLVVCNNSMYGTIRMHQQRDFPGRVSGTALTNPDFVALARSFGCFSARAETADDFPPIWEQAQKSGQACVIEIVMDPRQITTRARL